MKQITLDYGTYQQELIEQYNKGLEDKPAFIRSTEEIIEAILRQHPKNDINDLIREWYANYGRK